MNRLLPLTCWRNRDNPEELVLLKGEPAVVHDTTGLTRVVVGLDDDAVLVDSVNHPTAFSWPVAVAYQGATVNGLRLKLGLVPDLAAGTYGDCRLIVYDATNWPNGLVWSEAFKVKVR